MRPLLTTPASVALTATHGLVRVLGDNELLVVPQSTLIQSELHRDAWYPAWLAHEPSETVLKEYYWRLCAPLFPRDDMTYYWVRATAPRHVVPLNWHQIDLYVDDIAVIPDQNIKLSGAMAGAYNVAFDWNGWLHPDNGLQARWHE